MSTTRARRTLDVVEAELRVAKARADALYWTFTRTKRGKPPCLVEPDLPARIRALELEARSLRKK